MIQMLNVFAGTFDNANAKHQNIKSNFVLQSSFEWFGKYSTVSICWILLCSNKSCSCDGSTLVQSGSHLSYCSHNCLYNHYYSTTSKRLGVLHSLCYHVLYGRFCSVSCLTFSDIQILRFKTQNCNTLYFLLIDIQIGIQTAFHSKIRIMIKL